ncbi:recombination regulator RecX [Polaromonas sp. P5_D5]
MHFNLAGSFDMENPADSSPAKPARRAGFGLSLKGRALRYLAAREHSRAELERKLAPHEETPGQLKAVLDDLELKDFISEERVIDSVINRRSRKLGASRIQQELQAKGLDVTAIREAVGQLKATERERARDIWQRKFGTAPANPAEHARQIRFLAGRGFTLEVASWVLKNPDNEGA